MMMMKVIGNGYDGRQGRKKRLKRVHGEEKTIIL